MVYHREKAIHPMTALQATLEATKWQPHPPVCKQAVIDVPLGIVAELDAINRTWVSVYISARRTFGRPNVRVNPSAPPPATTCLWTAKPPILRLASLNMGASPRTSLK